MTAEEVLRSSERSALNNNQMVSYVTGKNTPIKTKGKIKAFGAMGFITLAIIVAAVLFSSGNLIPGAISDRLIEETDVQYADAVESKKLVFQQAMKNGDLPENTIAVLKQHGVETEKADNGEIVLKMGDKTITADNFITEASTDANFYNAFNQATYSRAAYYYDDAAQDVFKKIGTTRNNYTGESDFDEVMDSLVGSGSNISVNNVTAVEKAEGDETYVEYDNTGIAASSSSDAGMFINDVSAQNMANSTTEATLNSADSLKVADTISKEQRSELFFLTFMENISKMKAGKGNQSKINEAMNYLYESHETEVVNVKTGEIIKTKGTALESPSLYAVLSGSKVNKDVVNNYSSDRVLRTVENKIGTNNSTGAITGTVASTEEEIRGTIGRFLNLGNEGASMDALYSVEQTINSSLVDNSYDTIKGINAGEFLVEGAVNVGKELAKASGATAGDAEAVTQYARLNSAVIAMDAAADRINRSPFDVTSKNTFLGSIFYKLAVANRGTTSVLSGMKTFANTVNSSVLALIPTSHADAAEGYLTDFGSCETYGTIGAVGTAQCTEVATFDPSTLNDTFNDPEFKAFVEANTTLSGSGSRRINSDSILSDFILYNNERITPLGVMDGGILDSLDSGSSSVPFVGDVIKMIKSFLGASETDKRIATGAEFVNSSSNSSWQDYKYAQRYVSLARATESLRQYAGDSTAYNNIQFFEGTENPVIAFINEYRQTAQR
ncbi:hypothetical protein IKF21_01250 [Candidatus Saccharibacteria bacterium]|nr:hypothetical protein [Candidatus Saccharibacteria bacterium]